MEDEDEMEDQGTAMTDDPRVPVGSWATLPVLGFKHPFPVGTIYCIGRNYADHAREMGHDPDREAPFFFIKSTGSLLTGSDLVYPTETDDLQHEIELVVAIGRDGDSVSVAAAEDLVFGYATGLDMTRRDRQRDAKAAGRPWDVAKSFPGAAPCSAIVRKGACRLADTCKIRLHVNGQLRQTGLLGQMIWRIPEQISSLSRTFGLRAGDLIFTGTPAGVGAVVPGDVMLGEIDGVSRLEVRVI